MISRRKLWLFLLVFSYLIIIGAIWSMVDTYNKQKELAINHFNEYLKHTINGSENEIKSKIFILNQWIIDYKCSENSMTKLGNDSIFSQIQKEWKNVKPDFLLINDSIKQTKIIESDSILRNHYSSILEKNTKRPDGMQILVINEAAYIFVSQQLNEGTIIVGKKIEELSRLIHEQHDESVCIGMISLADSSCEVLYETKKGGILCENAAFQGDSLVLKTKFNIGSDPTELLIISASPISKIALIEKSFSRLISLVLALLAGLMILFYVFYKSRISYHKILQEFEDEKDNKEGKKRYQDIFTLSHIPIAIYQNHKLVHFNEAFKALSGAKTEDQLYNLDVKDFLLPEIISSMQQIYQEILEDKKQVFKEEIKFRNLANEDFIADILLFKTIHNGDPAIHLIVYDLTEVYRLNRQRQYHESRYNLIFEQLNDAGLLIKNEKIIDCNSAAVSIYGFGTKEELLQKHPGELSPELQPNGRSSMEMAEEMMGKCLEKGNKRFEWLHKKPDGSTFWMDVNLSRITLNSEDYIHVIGRDITEKIQLSEALIQAMKKAEESNRLKSAFLANLSHELRTPMNGIIGFASLLEEANCTKEELLLFTNQIKSSAKRLLTMIDDIIDFSLIEAAQIKPKYTDIQIGTYIQSLITQYQSDADGKKLSLNFDLQLQNNLTINTDEKMLGQILENLISNAIKYTIHGSINLLAVKKENHISIKVSDTGVGIKTEDLEKIFDRFTRLNQTDYSTNGTGLGLSISKAYCQLLGYQLKVDSQYGSGSCFELRIPLQKSSKKDEKNLDLGDKTILIVDDDELSYTILRLYLQKTNARILWARNGQEAIELVRRHAIDLIFLDYRMPVMRGDAAITHIKNIQPSSIVIGQTSAAPDEVESFFANENFNEIIRKPPMKDEILKLLIKYLS